MCGYAKENLFLPPENLNIKQNNIMIKKLILIFSLLAISGSLYPSNKLVISNWFVTEPHSVDLPAFHQTENIAGKTFETTNLLSFDHINLSKHFPEEGKMLVNMNGNAIKWTTATTDSNGYIMLSDQKLTEKPQIAYLAVYIWADRYIHTTLELKSPHTIRAWVDGEQIGTKTTNESEENTVGKVTKELKLERGKHLLIIKTVKPTSAELDWKLMANFEIKEPFYLSDLNISLTPNNRKNIHHVLDGLKATSMQLSFDGKYYIVDYRQSLPPSDQSESWSELRRVSDQKLVHSFRNMRISQMQWLPKSNRISYTNTRDKKTSLFVHDIENGEIKILMEDLTDFSSYKWAPNEQFIIYALKEEGSSTKTDMRQVLGLLDRQPNFRNRNFLYQFDLNSGMHKRLTFGSSTTSLHDISPDSQKIIFSQNNPVYNSKSFSNQHVFTLNIADMKLDTLWFNEERSVRLSYSPDGKYLLATGGPSAFGGAGENVPEGTIPNNYDTQAYIYNLQDKTVKAFTKNFNPSVNSAHWNASDNHIYLLTTDEDFQRLYRYDVKKEMITLLDLGFEYVSSIAFAENEPVAVFKASQSNVYPKYFSLNLKNLKHAVIDDIEKETYRHVEFGDVKNWDFTASTGIEIKGRTYYPPGFNPDVKYPVIVYYYGGTTPVGRTFAGRYPFNVWAGNGYLVYVLQPSGATGFGQEFSAAHVNNWGITVADEIIEGTQKFLAAHPFADGTKVGCAGASYGGFMTMLLMTRTDIFAAAISHAGISSISSYWGEGYYGYAYSSEASAGSFPWNNPDLYINQSPLFHADKVNTPLLLLTGDSDTNVPPGESIQMYTALKILDRPAELIMVKGEDHHILTYGKRIQWHNTIMAWWDKYLKNQNEWWDEQYPASRY
jgi:dipeptidyl aminopeptidase/acylaminoacyl peptidase